MSLDKRVRLIENRSLHEGWSQLSQIVFDFQRRDGVWQTMQRDSFDCGHGATILLFNRPNRTVILTRQFRYSAYSDGYPDLLIETPAGLLDGASPQERIQAETEEETGFRINNATRVFEAYVSPGAVAQKIVCFVAAYTETDRVSKGGGLVEEGEDIEVLELLFDDAYAMIASGEIQDSKTIMLLQYAALNLFANR